MKEGGVYNIETSQLYILYIAKPKSAMSVPRSVSWPDPGSRMCYYLKIKDLVRKSLSF